MDSQRDNFLGHENSEKIHEYDSGNMKQQDRKGDIHDSCHDSHDDHDTNQPPSDNENEGSAEDDEERDLNEEQDQSDSVGGSK